MRRTVLVRGAGLAALAGAALAVDVARPADAATSGTGPDWINAASSPYNADPAGNTDSTSAINSALAAAATAPSGQVVYLPEGTYLTTGPLVFPTAGGVSLRGAKGATTAGSGAGSGLGTTIKPSSAWSTSLPVRGVISVIRGAGTDNTAINLAADVRDLWIDCSNLPSTSAVDGIAGWGAVHAVVVRDVGVFHAPGRGFGQYRNANATSKNFAEGWQFFDCVAQDCAGDGYLITGTDGAWIDCHAQGSVASDGFVVQGGNNRLIGCRGDLSAAGNGFTIDAAGGGGYLDATILVGCGTQRNGLHGLNIINSSSSGTSPRDPVVVDGCSFGGDGVAGSAAGIHLAGMVLATITNSQVLVHTEDVSSGCPKYAVSTASAGTAPGKPVLLQISGGFLNCAFQTIILDSAPASLRQVNSAGFAGGQWTNQKVVSVT